MSVSNANAAAVAAERGLWTTTQLAEETGLSFRVIDYYARRKLIAPIVDTTGTGTARLWDPYSADELLDLRRRIEACPFHPHARTPDRLRP